ncbi:Hypothetical predicted protein [Olea europaea subsp. europaea]|uniref:Uncharacterized protein n=1 Tax=Olea europaea subsp. europaea TaxID=158383 RepID=A0A8S0VM24_OLEEU|nr:Hypothetical predicted protein [Olea europaea subsp. europaea]
MARIPPPVAAACPRDARRISGRARNPIGLAKRAARRPASATRTNWAQNTARIHLTAVWVYITRSLALSLACVRRPAGRRFIIGRRVLGPAPGPASRRPRVTDMRLAGRVPHKQLFGPSTTKMIARSWAAVARVDATKQQTVACARECVQVQKRLCRVPPMEGLRRAHKSANQIGHPPGASASASATRRGQTHANWPFVRARPSVAPPMTPRGTPASHRRLLTQAAADTTISASGKQKGRSRPET